MSNNKIFWFHIGDDYRIGKYITVYENENNSNDLIPEEACPISFDIPLEGYRIYIVNEHPKYKFIWYKNLEPEEEFDIIYLKIYSQIHNYLPYKITECTISGKELGYYPEVSDNIKILPNIENEFIDEIKNNKEGYYFYFVIDENGNEIYTGLLNPV